MRTQVGIVGAGPAGLMLSHLLARHGIGSVVLEARSREYVEARVRAGVLEQGTVDLLDEIGVGERMHSEGLVHEGIELRFDRASHRIPFPELTGGRSIMLYGQQEVVKDLIAARLAAGGDVRFDVSDVRLDKVDGDEPVISFRHDGEDVELHCDFVAGCDGFHGVSRDAIPKSELTEYHREYPFGWLGILAAVAPSADEVTYTYTDRGFALMSLRSPQISRLYLQVDPDDDIANWPDRRIWDELHTRLAIDADWSLAEGPVLEKGITAMRSFVVEPLRYGRLFLTGDAAHIVPPTGAKGMNLAIADVAVLADAIAHSYSTGSSSGLDGYSTTALRRVWRAQHFSWWMTSMLHQFPDDDPYQRQLQLSQLRYTVASQAAAASLAENYVGLLQV
ncbi:MAG TPA: 4-hydroxybenzoate 3-monooxygenase [Acidothermaceae bacterium]|nr:4-hydroxybenzoate 3-monooxygenase [Acidothermaceae bacterium]